MLFKSLASQLDDVSLKDGVVTHYWSGFGNRDSDGDVIQRGAYAKTIAERGPEGANRIKFLWQHDPWDPIGVPRELTEDDRGLRAVTKVPATTRGRDCLILYEEGVLTEHSVGIDVLRRDEADQAQILEVRLWEGSVVTWGANPLTPFLGLKGEKSDAAWRRLSAQLDGMQKALKRPLTDETAEQLELSVQTLRGHLDGLQKSLRKSASLAGYTTLPVYDPTPGADNSAFIEALRSQLASGDAPTGDTAPPEDPLGLGTSGDGAPRDEAEALQLLINALD